MNYRLPLASLQGDLHGSVEAQRRWLLRKTVFFSTLSLCIKGYQSVNFRADTPMHNIMNPHENTKNGPQQEMNPRIKGGCT